MRHFFLALVLSFHVGCSHPNPSSPSRANASPQTLGSHNLFKLDSSNNSVSRAARCTPCGQDRNEKRPISNHLDPEYRGNGADNLGYDWSPMAWGGPAFPRRSKNQMGGMRGRDGRMMPGAWGGMQGQTPGAWGGSQGPMNVICDTCRSYWTGDDGRGGGGSPGRGGGRQYYMPGDRGGYGGQGYGDPSQGGYWQGDKMSGPQNFETRVMSPTVGVLVKPGSRIAYIPSRSGEMYWDGVSGGGTRWDGFSNGISWLGSGTPEWDRSDPGPREEKPGYGPASQRPGGDFPYGSTTHGGWDNRGKGYYYPNGPSNQVDPLWMDNKGYASNWHYGSTNQNGWNGNNMKWNYGKQWPDNDRAANRFYFNTPQDRAYGPSGGNQLQYGNQYPNYQPSSGYPSNFRPQTSWPSDGGYRINDRDPSSFQSGKYGGSGDRDRPWDYNTRDPFGYRRPGQRPDWTGSGGGYQGSGTYDKDPGKYQGGYGGHSSTDRNDYNKPWNGPSGYGSYKPGSGGFPHGGNRYPEEIGGSRPGHSGGGHLFYPNDGNRQPTYPGDLVSAGIRPTYPSGGSDSGGYPSAGNQGGSYPGSDSRPSTGYPGGSRPSVIYTGGRPSVGGSEPSTGGYPSTESSVGGYPSGGSRPSGYPGDGSRPSGYPGEGSRPSGYPSGGSRPSGYPSGGSQPNGGYPGPSSGSSQPGGGYPGPSSGYPSGGGSYPSGGTRPGGFPGDSTYPEGGSRPGGYPSGGSRPDGYPSGGSSFVGYPGGGGGSSYPSGGGGGGSSYPSGVSRPGGYYPGGSSPYPGTGSRPGSYLGGDNYVGGYPSGGRPDGYPSGGVRPVGYPFGVTTGGGRPSGYPGGSGRPDEYPSGGSRPIYPIRGQPTYPGGSGSGGGGLYQNNKKPGYYTGFITELGPEDGHSSYGGRYPNYFGGSYPGDKGTYPGKDPDRGFYGGGDSNRFPLGDKDRYPAYGEDRYSGGGGGGYPSGDRGGDKYYYGQSDGKGKYPGGYPSNHRYPGGGGGGGGGGSSFDGNSGSSSDKNSWNYGQGDHKEGIYRRSGGSYPPYRGGQYYTSSYLASMSTTSGSTQAGSEPKTQSVTKPDEVTQPTSDSS